MKQDTKHSFRRRLFSGGGWALFTMLVWEFVEETLEYCIAFCVSSVITMLITKALTTLAIVTATQVIKVGLKRFTMAFIREITYKEGDDKVNTLKKILKTIFANKCTILGILVAVCVSMAGSGVVDIDNFAPINIETKAEVAEVIQEEDVLATEIVYEDDGTTIKYNVGDVITPAGTIITEGQSAEYFNLTPIIFYAIMAILTILASFFPESIDKFTKRIAEKVAEKQAKADEKEALKEIEAEEAQANKTLVQQEKEAADAEAKKRADEEKAKAEAEHRKKIDEIKAKIKAEKEQQTTEAVVK